MMKEQFKKEKSIETIYFYFLGNFIQMIDPSIFI